jgi:hypothetical protein
VRAKVLQAISRHCPYNDRYVSCSYEEAGCYMDRNMAATIIWVILAVSRVNTGRIDEENKYHIHMYVSSMV